MLDRVTPLILTYNEAPNIGRTLEKLRWAHEVVVLDSGSTDDTASIARTFANVRIVVHPFASHAEQWNHGLEETGIATEWVLALDADFVLSDELIKEIGAIEPAETVSGFRARFVYCVDGRPLRATLYPPLTLLFRRSQARYWQDGHTQRLRTSGAVMPLRHVVFHDDRKSLSHWVAAQDRYARLEAEKLITMADQDLGWRERLRRLRVLAPFAMVLYCLFGKRLILDGRPGVFYSFQRGFAELLLSLHLMARAIEKRRGNGTGR